MKIDYTQIADSILCGVDYDIYKDDINEMGCELRDQIEYCLRQEFGVRIEKLTKAFQEVKTIALREKEWRLEDSECGGCEVQASLSMLSFEIDKLLGEKL